MIKTCDVINTHGQKAINMIIYKWKYVCDKALAYLKRKRHLRLKVLYLHDFFVKEKLGNNIYITRKEIKISKFHIQRSQNTRMWNLYISSWLFYSDLNLRNVIMDWKVMSLWPTGPLVVSRFLL